MLIILIMSLIINILSFKKWFDNWAKYDNLTDKIQPLERPTNDNKKKYSDSDKGI